MIETEERAGYRVCTLDAGRRNVLGRAAVDALAAALAPDPERPTVVLRGRSDGLCAGLDTRVLTGGRAEAEGLLAAMGRVLADVLSGATRLLVVCEGHAVAAGAMLLLVADRRLAVPGDYRIGFTEPRIGMALPELPALLARARIARPRLHALTVLGETVGPEEAAAVGFVDGVVAPLALEERIEREAEALAALSTDAYAGSLRAVHGPLIDRVQALAAAQEDRARKAIEPV